jgi:hypothetical protein
MQIPRKSEGGGFSATPMSASRVSRYSLVMERMAGAVLWDWSVRQPAHSEHAIREGVASSAVLAMKEARSAAARWAADQAAA